MRGGRRWIVALLVLAGLVALAIGVTYLTVKANSLPSFLGKLSNFHGHRTRRGEVAVVVGAVLLVGAVALAAYPRRRTAS